MSGHPRRAAKEGEEETTVNGYWKYKTQWGTFAIIPQRGRFEVMFDDENLGSYHTAVAALDDLVGGHTFSPSNGLDTSDIGLPDELAEWTFVKR